MCKNFYIRFLNYIFPKYEKKDFNKGSSDIKKNFTLDKSLEKENYEQYNKAVDCLKINNIYNNDSNFEYDYLIV